MRKQHIIIVLFLLSSFVFGQAYVPNAKNNDFQQYNKFNATKTKVGTQSLTSAKIINWDSAVIKLPLKVAYSDTLTKIATKTELATYQTAQDAINQGIYEQLSSILAILNNQTTPLIGIYVDADNGDDTNGDGTISKPYKTLAKVTSLTIAPGTNIFLKRGCIWREQFVVADLDATASEPIIISAYGSGSKPKIYGSSDGDRTNYWTSLGSNKWATPNSSFTKTVYLAFYNTNTTQTRLIQESTENALNANWEYFYDGTNDRVIVYNSIGSPETVANGIEICGNSDRDNGENDMYLIRSDYWTVRDIDFRYSNAACFASNSSNTSIVNCDFRYSYNNGIYLCGNEWNIANPNPSNHNLVDGCYMLHTG